MTDSQCARIRLTTADDGVQVAYEATRSRVRAIEWPWMPGLGWRRIVRTAWARRSMLRLTSVSASRTTPLWSRSRPSPATTTTTSRPARTSLALVDRLTTERSPLRSEPRCEIAALRGKQRCPVGVAGRCLALYPYIWPVSRQASDDAALDEKRRFAGKAALLSEPPASRALGSRRGLRTALLLFVRSRRLWRHRRTARIRAEATVRHHARPRVLYPADRMQERPHGRGQLDGMVQVAKMSAGRPE